MQKQLIVLILIGCSVFLTSCDKEAPQIDPRKAILGKWEITHRGSVDDLRPYPANGIHLEYDPDSVLSFYRNDTLTSQVKYWFEDLLLIESVSIIDDVTNETIELKYPYTYKFPNSNKLQLEFIYSSFSGINTYYYERIK